MNGLMNGLVILDHAVAAVLAATDADATFYEAQDAVESWAMYALECAHSGTPDGLAIAARLLGRYAPRNENGEIELAPWSHEDCDDDEHAADSLIHRSMWDADLDPEGRWPERDGAWIARATEAANAMAERGAAAWRESEV